MDFSFSKETISLREEVRQFLDKEWPKEDRNWRGWEQPDTPEFLAKADKLYQKLGANNRTEAVSIALREKIYSE